MLPLPYIDVSHFMASITKALGPRTTASLGALVCYIAVCRGLRYLRRDTRHAQYNFKTRGDFSKMTAEEAWQIVRYIHALEFPWMSAKALAFALFKTYGVPTISKLLCDTKQLAEVENAGRRFSDTGILIIEFLGFSPTSERANAAIARMNYLHNKYKKAGKISNDDFLFTLSLFVIEVEKWIRQYEWRSLTPMEICAMGTHWKAIGDAMGIQYDDLRHGPNNFRDGLEFFEDLVEWAAAYEERAMVPSKWNHQLAEETARILLLDIPWFLKPYGKQIVIALMEPRLRRSMMYNDPAPIYTSTINTIFAIRKLLLRWLIPPRPYSLRYSVVSEHPDPKTGRYYTTDYDAEPWYVKPTFSSRNTLVSWYHWATGRPYPDGINFKPEGYTHFEIGPRKFENQGLAECIADRDRLMASGRGGCPFGHG